MSVSPAADQDAQLIAALVRRVQELEFELQKAKTRVANSSVARAAMAYALAAAGLLTAIFLAVAPYFKVGHFRVATVVSYVSIFASLCFVYLFYVAHSNLAEKRELNDTLLHAIKDGDFILLKAKAALAKAMEEASYEE